MRPHPAHLAEAIPLISLATTSILQSFGWKFATDFEMEGEKKGTNREKYGCTTCTNASLSPAHT